MSLANLLFDADTGIATITVNRPEVLNAIDVATARAIGDAVATLRDDDRVRCIVLKGNGRAFIAGGDLAKFADDFDKAGEVVDELLDALHPAIKTLREHNAPVIASVHGSVAGAGLSLMLACDLVIAAAGTKFLVAYDRIGASPDCGGTRFLPMTLGTRRAAAFMLLSQVWTADEAERMGLINWVVPQSDLGTETDGIARRIASGPTRAFGAYKRLTQRISNTTLDEHLELERAAFKAATLTDDFRSGVTGFLKKSPVTFSGR